MKRKITYSNYEYYLGLDSGRSGRGLVPNSEIDGTDGLRFTIRRRPFTGVGYGGDGFLVPAVERVVCFGFKRNKQWRKNQIWQRRRNINSSRNKLIQNHEDEVDRFCIITWKKMNQSKEYDRIMNIMMLYEEDDELSMLMNKDVMRWRNGASLE